MDDWGKASALLATVPDITVGGGAGFVSLGENVEVADLVARLVQGGVRISAVEPQRRSLEEIYLSITHESATVS